MWAWAYTYTRLYLLTRAAEWPCLAPRRVHRTRYPGWHPRREFSGPKNRSRTLAPFTSACPDASARSHVLQCVCMYIHVVLQCTPAATPTTITNRTGPGFRVGFSPWKRRDCRGPAWPSEAWPLVRFFFFVLPSLSLSLSTLPPLTRDSLPFVWLSMPLRAHTIQTSTPLLSTLA